MELKFETTNDDDKRGKFLTMTRDTITVSRSELSTYQRCERKWFYSYREDLKKQDLGNVAMSEGTLGHLGLAAAYSYMQECQQTRVPFNVDTAKIRALDAMAAAITRGFTEYRGEQQELLIKPKDHEIITRMGDVVQHYLTTHAYTDYGLYKIVSVERLYEVEYLLPFGGSVVVTGQMDTVMQDMDITHKRVAVVCDHKFVGDASDALEFLPMDLQMLIYEHMMWTYLVLETGQYDDVKILYDTHSRNVPPGFGNRELKINKDGSIAKNNANRDPEHYYKRAFLQHSDRERRAIFDNYVRPLLETVWKSHHGLNDYYPRRPIKTGGESCVSCYAKTRCQYDLLGRHRPAFGVSSLPTDSVRPLPGEVEAATGVQDA